MEPRVAYCSACDRPVRVIVKGNAPEWPSSGAINTEDIVCLEHGETCTGSMCPLFEVPTEQMKRKLADLHRTPEEGG